MRSPISQPDRSLDRPSSYHSATNASISDSPSSSGSEDEDESLDLCQQCEAKHVRRRLVICADGTWMVPDGAVGSFNGHASNMARIWLMIKEGPVKDPSGKRWHQKRAFVPGIGAVSDPIERTYAGITGDGYAEKIKQVYKLCCTEMCPSDEVFLFGFSRGAFVVRAVAGLLHHMRMLDVTASDFDAKFDNAIRLYRAAQNKDRLRENSVYQHLSSTKRGPCIKFMGLIDTVKALADDNLHDIEATKSVHHTRHALALFEKRTVMSPERFNTTGNIPADHSIQEAWFMGTHGNLGGSCEQDGLSLWPLQWLVSEAKRYGLVLGFQHFDSSNVTDPAALISQRRGETDRNYLCKNGVEIHVADLSTTLTIDGFSPTIKLGKKKFPTSKEFRPLFQNDELIGLTQKGPSSAFIHPSVFFLDDTVAEITYAMIKHPDAQRIRAQRSQTMASGDKPFWVGGEELQVLRRSTCPRILLCGQLNAGKTSLVNKMVGFNAVGLPESTMSERLTKALQSAISHGEDPGEHDVNVAFSNPSRSIMLHDSQGFEAAKSSNYHDVSDFVKERRGEPVFQNQIHCIWYCVSTDLQRIQKVDKKFTEIDLGGVPVVLVFTKTDKLKRTFDEQALYEYNRENHSSFTIYQIASMPDKEREKVLSNAHELLEAEKMRRTTAWKEKFPGLFSDFVFIANPECSAEDQDTIPQLMDVSVSSMTGDRMARIHAQAQDNFIKDKWNLALDVIIKICDKKADLISCLLKYDARRLRREIVQLVMQKLAGIFKLEGFDQAVAFPAIAEILYPVATGTNSAVKAGLGLTASLVLGGVGAALLGTVGWLATTSAFAVGADLSNSNVIVISCLEIAFVMERIFWFGISPVDEKIVNAATLYYLKRRKEVLETSKKKLSRFDSIKDMKPTLSEVVKQYRYQRQSLGNDHSD